MEQLFPHAREASNIEHNAPHVPGQNNNAVDSKLFASGVSSWARNFRLPIPVPPGQGDSKNLNLGMSAFSRLTSGLGLGSPTVSESDDKSEINQATEAANFVESFTKGLVDSSRIAVKAMQVKARHMVSQNKRRYQEEGFDLDMTYITENIIAMGFPAGDISSGLFGFLEGFYRNHMEEVISFLDTHHKGNYKVYNLCSERLYDASLFQGKVASFPFDDHNCPPVQLIASFCRSAYSWLKEDIQNVVVVHCKAGMGRTGVMICSLLLYLKFFPTAEEAIDFFNQKRCTDGKALILPSQIRYVKYFDRIMTYFDDEFQPGRRCMLRAFRLHRCPYWVRPSITISDHNGILFTTRKHPKTKDLMPEDFWISTPKKGVFVFALPGERGLAELVGDFKLHFHDRHGDFYCWLNTTMVENRIILSTSDFDDFDKRKIPSPGLQIELLMVDYNGNLQTSPKANSSSNRHNISSGENTPSITTPAPNPNQYKVSENEDNVFSDSEGEETSTSARSDAKAEPRIGMSPLPHVFSGITDPTVTAMENQMHQRLSLKAKESKLNNSINAGWGKKEPFLRIETPNLEVNEIKAIAADASVFSFGDEDDFESD